jgi:cytochrome c oxidase subunit 3
VRNAQLGQKTGLCINLTITILCAFAFMGIKYQEYSHKFHVGLNPFTEKWEPLEGAFGDHAKAKTVAFVVPQEGDDEHAAVSSAAVSSAAVSSAAVSSAAEPSAEAGEHVATDGHVVRVPWTDPAVPESTKRKLSIFFGIYFCMTGLHGIHVLVGIFILGWLLTRAIRGHFTPTYYGPIDYTALYWHIVDLIWIFLFPLLYLIN